MSKEIVIGEAVFVEGNANNPYADNRIYYRADDTDIDAIRSSNGIVDSYLGSAYLKGKLVFIPDGEDE